MDAGPGGGGEGCNIFMHKYLLTIVDTSMFTFDGNFFTVVGLLNKEMELR